MSLQVIVGNIRNLLRVEAITGKASIDYCVTFLVCRFLEKDTCIKLEIPEKFSFSNLIQLEEQELYESFYCPGCLKNFLAYYLFSKLNMTFIKDFKLKSPKILYKIYQCLKEISLKDSMENYDLVGNIYELHLKSGSNGGGMRDLGQYFTNRKIIEFMIDLCQPCKEDTIVDPTMGIGGFLVMAKKKLPWIKKENIIGFDISPDVANLASLNMLLETFEWFPHFYIRDVLYRDMVLSDGSLLQPDIILANGPMGIKGIDYDQCCERIKELGIKGTIAVPLFVQLFVNSLKEKGKAVFIVPDGFLFSNDNLHVRTREYLISHFNIKEIISLSGSFFINTGVKTSIIYLCKEPPAESIRFSNLSLREEELVKEEIFDISLSDVKEKKYNLFTDNYKKTEKKSKDVHANQYLLGDLVDIKQGSFNSSQCQKEGEYPFYTGKAKQPEGYFNDYCFDAPEYLIFIKGGGSGKGKYSEQIGLGKSFYVQGKNAASSSQLAFIPKVKLNVKYLYFYLNSIRREIMELALYTTGLGSIRKSDIENIIIQLPTLEKQKEIVEKLEIFSRNNKRLGKYVKDSKEILSCLVFCKSKCFEQYSLGNLVNIKQGSFNSSQCQKEGEYPFYSGKAKQPEGYFNDYCFDAPEYLIFIKSGGSGKGKYSEQIGLGKSFYVQGKSASSGSQLAFIPKIEFNVKYLYFYLNSIRREITELALYTTGLGHIRKSDIENIAIYLPPLEKQEEIVKECVELQEEIETLEERINKNEILAREVLSCYLQIEDKQEHTFLPKINNTSTRNLKLLSRIEKLAQDKVLDVSNMTEKGTKITSITLPGTKSKKKGHSRLPIVSSNKENYLLALQALSLETKEDYSECMEIWH